MNKNFSIIVTFALIIGIGIVFFGGSLFNSSETGEGISNNVEIRDGIQYIEITARGGYSPKISEAAANIPTKLIVKTQGTYDCSAALVVRDVGFQKILDPTGEEVIDLYTPKAGQSIQGLCSMGMYRFVVQFT
ncbi:hypothetical protein CVV38_03525 [Candidatus Peregrinibacteria bacterium HGW-Peregrinibacteria-1]|jgi:plastocyanin domain-containing protein|nr:MAG: hypothetical protein CVV38_03525 [Candidatus Peregrinibacteria bacterium HGW-Peregrinibacteria-1]